MNNRRGVKREVYIYDAIDLDDIEEDIPVFKKVNEKPVKVITTGEEDNLLYAEAWYIIPLLLRKKINSLSILLMLVAPSIL